MQGLLLSLMAWVLNTWPHWTLTWSSFQSLPYNFPLLIEQISGMLTTLNLKGLLTLQPLLAVTVGTTCECTVISLSSCPVIQCWLISCRLWNLPKLLTHGGESAIAGQHNGSLCWGTFNTSAESSPWTCTIALVGERDLINHKRTLKSPVQLLAQPWALLYHQLSMNLFAETFLASLCWLHNYASLLTVWPV